MKQQISKLWKNNTELQSNYMPGSLEVLLTLIGFFEETINVLVWLILKCKKAYKPEYIT